MMEARHGRAGHSPRYPERAHLTVLVLTHLSSLATMACSLLKIKLFLHLAAKVTQALVLICTRHTMVARPGLQPSLLRQVLPQVRDQTPSLSIPLICNMPGRLLAPTSMQPAMGEKAGHNCHLHHSRLQ